MAADFIALLIDLARQPCIADAERLLPPSAPSPHWAALYQDTDESAGSQVCPGEDQPLDPDLRWSPEPLQSLLEQSPNLLAEWPADRHENVSTGDENGDRTPRPAGDRRRSRTGTTVRWIILDSSADGDKDFLKAAYKGSDLLDTHIANHFVEQARFGSYIILTR